MNVFKSVLRAVFVPKCRMCGEKLRKNDLALCRRCRAEYENSKHRICRVCRRKYIDCSCPPLRKEPAISAYAFLFRYKKDTPGGALILSLKDRKDGEALSLLTSDFAKLLGRRGLTDGDCVVTYVPRSADAVLKKGVDQAKELAAKTAKKCGLPFVTALKTGRSSTAQKELNAAQRLTHAENIYSFKGSAQKQISGKRVILIDDVLTTGATTAVCAQLLAKNGAKDVAVLCAGRT